MKRRRMEPTTVETEGREFEIHCRHEDTWPPTYAKMGEDFDQLRDTKRINEVVYQQLKVWERMCGLLKMDPDKCVSCPNAMTPNKKGRLIPLGEVVTPPSRPHFARAQTGRDSR
jgi:hypothetical protein